MKWCCHYHANSKARKLAWHIKHTPETTQVRNTKHRNSSVKHLRKNMENVQALDPLTRAICQRSTAGFIIAPNREVPP